jgi:Sortilin, neurotensin receptor 3,
LSRDGGLNWSEVRKGSHIYEIGDHGGLLIMAGNINATTEIIYSFNEGLTWHEMTISDTPIRITNIIIEPKSVS